LRISLVSEARGKSFEGWWRVALGGVSVKALTKGGNRERTVICSVVDTRGRGGLGVGNLEARKVKIF